MTYRKRANLILFLSFVLFLLSLDIWCLYPDYMGAEAFLYIAQSALIGSVADWFAVTALFEKPLGFPYHTELLHRQRGRITRNLSELVSKKLITPSFWQRYIQNFSVSYWLWRYMDTKEGQEQYEKIWTFFLRHVMALANQKTVQGQVSRGIQSYMSQLSLGSWLQNRLNQEMKRKDSAFVTSFFQLLANKVQGPMAKEGLIVFLQEKWVERKEGVSGFFLSLAQTLDIANVEEFATQLQERMVQFLEELQDEESPLRQWLQGEVYRGIHEPDSFVWQSIDRWQEEIQDLLPLEEWLAYLARYSEERLLTEVGLTPFAKAQAQEFLSYIRQKEAFSLWLDEQVQGLLIVLFQNQSQVIGLVVERVLSGFSKERFNEFLETKVGEDLSWIRINGAIVGAVLGLFLYTLMRVMDWLYQ